MKYEEIINNKYAEPAALITYKDGELGIAGINEKYIPELWMNVSTEDYIEAYPDKVFDEDNRKIFLKALKKCVESGEEQTVETWRLVFSACCGYDRICLKSRLVLVENTPEGALVYEAIRNLSNEKRTQDTLEDIEYRYKQASEQINIYNWEYTVATKGCGPATAA